MDEKEREDTVVAALAAQYPKIWAWRPAKVEVPYGPDDMEHVNKFADRVARMRSACKESLLALPDEELLRMRDFQSSENQRAPWPWADHLPSNPNDCLRRIPKVWAYGFGHPAFAPDFDYWAMMPKLSVMEATMLSVGAKPELMTQEEIYELKRQKPEKLWASFRFLIERYELMFRMYPSGGYGKMHLSTRRLYQWINETGLEVHPGFKAALDKRFGVASEPAPPKEMTDAEKVSLLKIIAGMAIEQYAYDPGAQRSDAIRNISDDLERLGISLDRKTIRKWLKEACELVDPEYLSK